MNRYREEPANVSQTLVRSGDLLDASDEISEQNGIAPEISASRQPSIPATGNSKSVTIGLVDSFRLTRECLTSALCSLHPEIRMSSFTVVQECIDAMSGEFDLIVYCPHNNDASGGDVTQTVTAINRENPNIPVLVFSYSDCAHAQTTLHSILQSGARGFVPAKTATLSIVWAAIGLVSAGGAYFPPDLMLAASHDRPSERLNRLTLRQSAVFERLRLGDANKIIAYELGMCESTVKVHIRNIMRKVGATNRTQAAFKGLRFLNDRESTMTSTGAQNGF
jgi:DNA-binding NarL/FixJ family response regulator